MKILFHGLIGLVVVAATLVLAMPTIMHKADLHPEYHGPTFELPGKRALTITSSHGVLAAPRLQA